MDINERRRSFNDKLKRGLDQKTVMNGGEFAARYLSEAVELAVGPPRLEEPLLEIASYRLAHAKLRVAHTPEDYREIRQLLRRVERSTGYLGLMSRILELVTHHRLAWFEPVKSRQQSQEAINNVWEEVISALRRSEQNDVNSPLTKTTALLQSAPFSLVELAGYFSGCDLSSLDGVSYRNVYDSEFEGLSDQPAYIVCASNDEPFDVQRRIPQDIAIKMVDDRLNRGMADVGFILHEKSGDAFFKGRKELATKKVALLFGHVLGVLARGQIDLALDSSTISHYRDRINRRVRKAGLADDAVRYDPISKEFSFTPTLRVVGAISRELLSQRTIVDNWGQEGA